MRSHATATRVASTKPKCRIGVYCKMHAYLSEFSEFSFMGTDGLSTAMTGAPRLRGAKLQRPETPMRNLQLICAL